MSFFRKLGDALIRFMYGRNGMDQLNKALLWLSIGLIIVSNLIASISDTAAVIGVVIYYLAMAVWVISLFRTFSKNLEKRRGENAEWMRLWWKITNSAQHITYPTSALEESAETNAMIPKPIAASIRLSTNVN